MGWIPMQIRILCDMHIASEANDIGGAGAGMRSASCINILYYTEDMIEGQAPAIIQVHLPDEAAERTS
jgi:hypothetical protein